jgi:alcohol dehydrogenase
VPSDSQAALFHGPNKPWELRTVSIAPIGQGQILTRVLACTICGSDLHTICGRRHAHTPAILGHEIVAQIIEFGPDATRCDLAGNPLNTNDRIVWTVVANCGQCFFCQHDLPQKCQSGYKYGHQQVTNTSSWHGGFATHCTLLPGTQIVKVPEGVDDLEAAPLSCATATIAAAVRTANTSPDESILVIGAGMLGLTACAFYNSLYPQKLLCIEPDEHRRKLALQFGASQCAAPNQIDTPLGFDSVIECSGTNAGTLEAIRLVRTGGKIILVGAVFPSDPAPIVIEQLVRKHLSIHGVHNYQAKDLLLATEFMHKHNRRFPFKHLVEHTFPLEQIQEAIACAQKPQNIRVAILP